MPTLNIFDVMGFTVRLKRETFKKLSVIIYEDLPPNINCIDNGDKSPILSSHPILEFLTRYNYKNYNVYFYSLVTKMIILVIQRHIKTIDNINVIKRQDLIYIT